VSPIDLEPTAARAATADRQSELRRAAEAFEALFVRILLERMREAQLEDGLFGSGPGAQVYDGLFDHHLSTRMAGRSPFGIADALEARWRAGEEPDRPALLALEALDREGIAARYRQRSSGPQVLDVSADE
jgi:Rod binding domain-containing protein